MWEMSDGMGEQHGYRGRGRWCCGYRSNDGRRHVVMLWLAAWHQCSGNAMGVGGSDRRQLSEDDDEAAMAC